MAYEADCCDECEKSLKDITHYEVNGYQVDTPKRIVAKICGFKCLGIWYEREKADTEYRLMGD